MDKLFNNVNKDDYNFFEKYYEPVILVIQQPIGKNSLEILDLIHDIKTKDYPYKIVSTTYECRYCGKSKPTVSFNDIIHIIPESLGNKLIRSEGIECDSCNQLFGRTLEQDLAKYLKPFRVTNQTRGKRGKKKYQSRDGLSSFEWDSISGTARISVTQGATDSIITSEEEHSATLNFDIEPHTPLNVYKALVKIALSFLPESKQEQSNFKLAFDFIANKKTSNKPTGYENLLLSYFPGFNRFSLTVMCWRRKLDNFEVPYFQFAIMFGNIMLQIVVPSDKDSNIWNKSIQLASMPTPFDKSVLGPKLCSLQDLSSCDKKTDFTISMKLNFGNKTEIEPKDFPPV